MQPKIGELALTALGFVASIGGCLLAFLGVLVLGIAQVPAVIVTLPAIAWIWSRGGGGTGAAIIYTALLLVSGMADNVLKPQMLGRGVDVPMPVILIGALGGMATGGIIGMFVGATLLALAWQIFTGWVRENPDASILPGSQSNLQRPASSRLD